MDFFSISAVSVKNNRVKRSPTQAMTLTEVLIIVALLVLLAVVLLPPTSGEGLRGHMTRQVSNMKQLHLATQQMALDGITTGDTNLPGWTCRGTTPITFQEWTNLLIKGNYLSATDLKKLLSASYSKEGWFGRQNVMITNAVVAFAVAEDDPGNTLFLASVNWQGLAALGLIPAMYPTNGFVVFRKGGDGAMLQPRQAATTNLIGSGGMHNYLPLR